MKQILLFVLSIFVSSAIVAQVAVTTDGTEPNASAMLDVKSSNKGILIPRVSLTSITDGATVPNPATSLLVYNINGALSTGVGFYYNSGTAGSPTWVKILTGTSAGWSLTGNAGTDPDVNFIGTTDYQPLRFRTSNAASGFIDLATRSTFFGGGAGAGHTFTTNTQSTGFGYQVMSIHSGALNTAVGAFAMANNQQFGSRNSALGHEALFNNTSGQRNAAIGHASLYSNTTGDINTAVGDSAMAFNVTGNYNTAIGAYALKQNVSSSSSVAIGYFALEKTTAGTNTAIGVSSMRNNTTGTSNTAVGNSSLLSNLTGTRNTAVGTGAMQDNTTGQFNVAMGYHTIYENTTGNSNTAFGYLALNGNKTGDNNVAIGANALINSEVDGNTAVGFDALRANRFSTSNVAVGRSALALQSFTNSNMPYGGNNVAIGVEALYSNQPDAPTSGAKNVAVGNYALNDNTTGFNNTSIGYESLRNNTTGFWNNAMGVQSLVLNTTGSSNVSIGNNSMFNNTSGSNNVSMGIATLNGNTIGTNNTGLGYTALNANSVGEYNTAVGASAGSFNNANDYCTFLGYEADQTSGSNYIASMALGYNSRITASSQVRIGHSGMGSIGGYQAWSNLSDGRFKSNVNEQVPGLDFIMALRPVTYNIDAARLSAYLKEDIDKDENGKLVTKAVDPRIQEIRNKQSQVIHSGFIAQEVEAAAKKIQYDFSGVDKPKNSTDLYALRYSEFVVPLVKAVQEQQTEINDLKERIKRLEELLSKTVEQTVK